MTGIPIFADSSSLGVPPADVVTLSRVIGAAGRFAASFGPPRRRRPAHRSSSWQAGGTGTARHGSPSTGDDAGVGPPGLAAPGWIFKAIGYGDTPPAQCGSGRRGALSEAPPSSAGAPFPGGAMYISPGLSDRPLHKDCMLPG